MIKNKIIVQLICIILILSTFTVYAQSDSSTSSESKKYAVILVGQYYNRGAIKVTIPTVQQYYTWYLNDAGRIYSMLKERYDYSDENIFLLVNLLPNCLFDIPEDVFNISWVDGDCDEKLLGSIFESFKPGGSRELSESDQVLFLMINHGGVYNDGGISWIKPDAVIDNSWNKEEKSLDTKKDTPSTYNRINDNNWTDEPLTFTMDHPIKIKGIRIKANKLKHHDNIYIKFYNDSIVVKDLFFKNNNTVLHSWLERRWKYVSFRNYTTQEIDEYYIDKIEIFVHEEDPKFGFFMNPAKIYDFELWPHDDLNDIKDAFFGLTLNRITDIFLWRFIFYQPYLRLYDYEIADYVDGIEAKMIFLFQPCFGGALIDKISGDNRISCTSSRGFEPADSWIGPFRWALNKEVDADYNLDGDISISEAYEHTARWVENYYGNLFHPLIDDNGDQVGNHFRQSGFNPNNSTKDGYLAAHTFL